MADQATRLTLDRISFCILVFARQGLHKEAEYIFPRLWNQYATFSSIVFCNPTFDISWELRTLTGFMLKQQQVSCSIPH